MAEIKHAEAIAGRLSSFGEVPTTKPTPISLGTTLEQLLEQDEADDEGVMDLCRAPIRRAGDDGDVLTRRLFMGIRVEEADHHDTFVSLLEGA